MIIFESDIAGDDQDIEHPIGSCQWVRANAPGYVTGSLERAEMDLIADHRLLCRECDGAIERLHSVVALSALAADAQEPSPALKARLFAAVAADRQRAPSRLPVTAARPGPGAPPRPRSWWRTPRFASAGLMALILALATWGIYAQAVMSDRADAIAELERSNAAMATHLNSLQTGQQEIGAGISSYQLTNVSPAEDDAGGVIVSGVGENTAVFSVWNMPTDHASYHVICESQRGELLAAAEIVINERGTGSVTVRLPSPVTEFRAVHVIPTDSDGNAVADLLNQDILTGLMDVPASEE